MATSDQQLAPPNRTTIRPASDAKLPPMRMRPVAESFVEARTRFYGHSSRSADHEPIATIVARLTLLGPAPVLLDPAFDEVDDDPDVLLGLPRLSGRIERAIAARDLDPAEGE